MSVKAPELAWGQPDESDGAATCLAIAGARRDSHRPAFSGLVETARGR